jgi:hypothetical protein
MKNKAIWISYDFGLKGDYAGLYTWLDNHDALECGNGLAYFLYPIDASNNEPDVKSIIDTLTKEMKDYVKLSKSDRIYIILKDKKTNKVKGEFINGSRKQSPWQGYGRLKDSNKIDTAE